MNHNPSCALWKLLVKLFACLSSTPPCQCPWDRDFVSVLFTVVLPGPERSERSLLSCLGLPASFISWVLGCSCLPIFSAKAFAPVDDHCWPSSPLEPQLPVGLLCRLIRSFIQHVQSVSERRKNQPRVNSYSFCLSVIPRLWVPEAETSSQFSLIRKVSKEVLEKKKKVSIQVAHHFINF